MHNIFSVHYKSTIGVDFALKVINWDENTVVRLQLWDIAGQERFGNMTRVYYKEAVGAMVVFDITNNASWKETDKWKNDIDAKVQLQTANGPIPIPVVLLANKVDLDRSEEGFYENNKEVLDQYCAEHGFIGWFATSAKNNIDIDKAAKFLVERTLKNDALIKHQEKDSGVLDLTGTTPAVAPASTNGPCCG